MKRNLHIFLLALLCLVHFNLAAQVPNLPVKATLSTQLNGQRTFNNPSQRDILTLPFNPVGDYSLEVKAKVNAVTGRGLDIDARNANVKGFRLSLNETLLKSTAPLASPVSIATTRAGDEQTIRIAVRRDTAYIYQDGVFVYAKPTATIYDMLNGAEDPASTWVVDINNLTQNWGGTNGNNSGKPSAYGWTFSKPGVDPFTVANAGSGVRYVDMTAATTGSNVHYYNSNKYVGRIMYIRWDSANATGTVDGTYSIPVTLEANTRYDFSMLYTYVNNLNTSNSAIGKKIVVGVGTVANTSNIATHNFIPSETNFTMLKDNFEFTSQAAGTYYLNFTGGYALFSIGELKLNKLSPPPSRLILGKNYINGAVDMEVSSVSYEDNAYAPLNIISKPRQSMALTGNVVNVPAAFNTDFTVSEKTDVHFTGDPTPMINSSIAINSNDAWLFFDHVKPSVVISELLDKITINGAPVVNNVNARVTMFANGTVVIPYNNTDQNAVTFYSDENYGGASKPYQTYVRHTDLAEFDNTFKSFKLKRGYMVTIGSNPEGIGFSKVYIADTKDIEVPIMPKGLYGKTSFIRVLRWDYVSKKGWAGGLPEIANVTWNYDWNVGGNSTVNSQYVPIRQHGGWPDFNTIYNKTNTNTLLGFNEPDRPDQANMTVDQAIQQWPDLVKSGFRLGSPAPSDPNNWLKQFMNKADSLNYRVDFVAVHAYWNNRVSQGRADAWQSGLSSVFNNYGKRPVWITEWNNGANWTGESWPSNMKDALARQAAELPLILQVMDTLSVVERYSLYNWVEDKRAVILADTLTPAGKLYAANKSKLAYNSDPTVYRPSDTYDHKWRISAPIIRYTLSNDYTKAIINWRDINGDLGTKYVLQRKKADETNFVSIKEYVIGTDYVEAGNLSFEDDITSFSAANYRLCAISYEGNQSWYSAELVVKRDALAAAPSLSGETISSKIIKLNWTEVPNARSYRLKRSTTLNGTYVTVVDYFIGATYTDTNLDPNTTYYYKLSGMNSGGEGTESVPFSISTPAFTTPNAVSNFRVASGDTKTALTWDFMYDAKYSILRSNSVNGLFTEIAPEVDATRYEDTGLQNGTTYYYKVVAHNEAGSSPESAVLSRTPILGQHLAIAFDENTGTKVYDVWGGYHGNLTNVPIWTSGKEAGSSAITLVKSASSYVQLPQGIVSTLSDFTVATWVKLPANQGTNTRIFDFGSGTGTFMVLIPRQSATAMRYKITYPGGNYQQDIPYVLPLDQWIHVAVSQQGTQLKVYVNAQEIFTDNTATIKPSDMGFTTQNYLGRSQWPSDPYSDHTYDDFKIYNYALPLNSIQALANISVLPVKLNNFTAKKQNNSEVLLKWETLSETNSRSFVIERSTDGVNFVSIGEQLAKGNATSLNSYSFVDKRPMSGNNYYRLKQVDINNDFDYSAVEQVKMTIDNPNLQVYPNPASSYVQLSGLETNKIHSYALFNILGLKVASGKVLNGRIDLPQLPDAVYTLQILEGNKNTANHKIIIRR